MTWQDDGVQLVVELSTSGNLVEGSNRTQLPFEGGPIATGWASYVFSGVTPTYSVITGGIQQWNGTGAGSGSGILYRAPAVVGRRYRITADVRKYPGVTATQNALLRIFAINSVGTQIAGPWQTEIAGTTDEWLTLTVASAAMPANTAYVDFVIMGSHSGVATTTFGIQTTLAEMVDMDPNSPPAKEWHDATCDVQSAVIRHGRERFTNRYDIGSFVVTLRNEHGLYSYNNVQPINLRPGRILRVSAVYGGTSYPMCYGAIDSIVDDYGIDGHVVSTITAYDMTSVTATLNSPRIRATQHGTWTTGYTYYWDRSGERVTTLLDYVGYFPRAIDVGEFAQKTIEDSGRTIRDELGVTADSEGGGIYADRIGQIVYKDRNWSTEEIVAVTADLLAMPHDGGPLPIIDTTPNVDGSPIVCNNQLNTDWSMERVVNWVELANVGGTARRYQDSASQKLNGVHTYQRLDFVNYDNATLDLRAADIMTGYADPELRVNSTSFRPSGDDWEWTLSAFLNWLVRIWYAHPINLWGYAACTHVQSVEHRITQTEWSVTMAVDAPTEVTYFSLSDRGWDTSVWDEDIWDG